MRDQNGYIHIDNQYMVRERELGSTHCSLVGDTRYMVGAGAWDEVHENEEVVAGPGSAVGELDNHLRPPYHVEYVLARQLLPENYRRHHDRFESHSADQSK